MKQKAMDHQHSKEDRPDRPQRGNVMPGSPACRGQSGEGRTDVLGVFRGGTAAEVTIIPATKQSLQNSILLKDRINARVAAYCRVSTEDEFQEESFAGQCRFL